MEEQLAFGKSAPQVRATDPQVARNAAERAGRGLGKSKARMLCAYRFGGELAPSEAAELLVRRGDIPLRQLDSHRRRAQDLAADGFLEATGEERHGIVYRLTAKGKGVLGEAWAHTMHDPYPTGPDSDSDG